MANSSSLPKRSHRRSPPPLKLQQQCVAQSMGQIISNMFHREHQEKCKQLLQIDDVSQAETKIMEMLQKIEAVDIKKKSRRLESKET